jgi:signal transduction histidine kinase
VRHVIAHLAWVLVVSAWAWRRDAAVARARHEVRGPLAVARLALAGLERSARVEAIDLELRRAALALDDLGGVRRSGAVAAVDIGRVLSDAAPAWCAFAESRGAALVVEPSCVRVAGEPLRLAQACANLVTNAVEHGGGYVLVCASSVNGHARVEVRDDGPGLPASIPALVAAARGRRSHRGHGLAIAAAIARSHGGRLISLPCTQGAHLALELPLAPPRPRPRRSWPPPIRRSAASFPPLGSASSAPRPPGSASSAAPEPPDQGS